MLNRKYNHTINQDVARRDPKWEVMPETGGQVLVRRVVGPIGSPTHVHYLRRGENNKWEGMPAKDLSRYLKVSQEPALTAAKRPEALLATPAAAAE